MSVEWGPWIEHDGKGCPVAAGVYICVEYELRGKTRKLELYNPGEALSWRGGGYDACEVWQIPIIRYRVRKPKGLTIPQGLLEELPEGVGA